MRRKILLRLIIGIAFPAAVIFVLFWALCINLPLPCIFYQTTGLYCPSCGATRAIISLVHGDIINALKNNLFITITSIPLLLLLTRMWLGALLNRKSWLIPNNNVIKILFASAILYILFGILRNIPVVPFIWLNPIN